MHAIKVHSSAVDLHAFASILTEFLTQRRKEMRLLDVMPRLIMSVWCCSGASTLRLAVTRRAREPCTKLAAGRLALQLRCSDVDGREQGLC